ncbi:MAG: translation initiation factor IF-3 [Verrucomicrobia bacterium]|nr:MAG: translation initiation factor IF-3 [Verrucomicrobiota bacterium]
MSRPFSPRSSPFAGSFVRVNGKIRAREVRVVAQDGKQLGVLQLGEAINLARAQGVDLVEIAPNATPPVCRLVDYGKFRYEQAKKEEEIDPHDFGVKLNHAIGFLCEDMKVKATLRFRGREMAHQEFGFQVVKKFIRELAPYGHPDAEPKLIGKGLNVMLSPLPRNKRAKNPRQTEENGPLKVRFQHDTADEAKQEPKLQANNARIVPTNAAEKPSSEFGHNPFARLDAKLGSS